MLVYVQLQVTVTPPSCHPPPSLRAVFQNLQEVTPNLTEGPAAGSLGELVALPPTIEAVLSSSKLLMLQPPTQPAEYGQQRTLNMVHAQTAAQQKSNGSYKARMSGKCGEWRD